MPQVNHKIMMWARESAGLSLAEAAARLDIHEGDDTPAERRLWLLEKGDDDPSRQLLVRMSKVYRRPLLTFYLSKPPLRGDRGEDFRTLPQQQSGATNALVDALLRDVRARQSMVRSTLEDEGEAPKLSFVGSAKAASGVAPLVAAIRKTIGVDTAKYQSQKSVEEAFALLRSGTENAGVFALLIGDLGSYHTSMDVELFRGFALADNIAPFIVINDHDAKPAWSFTLIHELAHIWLGASGISGAYADSAIERFCNEVAAEFLLPKDQLAALDLGSDLSIQSLQSRIGRIAASHNLSATMVAYRLYLAGLIETETWENTRKFFRNQWLANREVNRSQGRDGPSYYVVRRHRVGDGLIKVVGRTMAEGILTPTRAGKILGVKPHYVHEIVRGAEGIK